MTRRLFALSFIALLLLSQPPTFLAQDAPVQQGWAAVQAVRAGSKVLIETKNGERIEGKLNSASDTILSLTSKNRTVSLNRAEIQRVYRLRRSSRAKYALIGAGVGAGVGVGGAAVALGATGGSDAAGALVTSVALISTGIGAAIGAAVGKGSKRTLIYESP